MLNFILGTVAGGLIVGIATIAAVRQPDVQARLGLFPVSTALMMPSAHARGEPACPQRPAEAAAAVGQPDMLFSKRRFWSVAP